MSQSITSPCWALLAGRCGRAATRASPRAMAGGVTWQIDSKSFSVQTSPPTPQQCCERSPGTEITSLTQPLTPAAPRRAGVAGQTYNGLSALAMLPNHGIFENNQALWNAYSPVLQEFVVCLYIYCFIRIIIFIVNYVCCFPWTHQNINSWLSPTIGKRIQ